MGQNQHTKKSDLSKDRLCVKCNREVRRKYNDKLCGSCYLSKKAAERRGSDEKVWF